MSAQGENATLSAEVALSVFCPNCGTPNESTATSCKNCGYKLSRTSPKFAGTMVMRSERSVQEMLDEQKRRAREAAAERGAGRGSEPPPARPSSTPPGSTGFPRSSRGPVLAPPRVDSSRRRVGGTMLGVAPQGGGILPPRDAEPPREPAPEAAAPAKPHTAGPASPMADGSGVAPTAAMPRMGTPPVDAAAAPPVDAAAVAAEPAEAPGAEAERSVPVTAPLPPAPTSDVSAPSQVIPPRLTAVDVLLIIGTFGIYGVVLWARRRSPSAR